MINPVGFTGVVGHATKDTRPPKFVDALLDDAAVLASETKAPFLRMDFFVFDSSYAFSEYTFSPSACGILKQAAKQGGFHPGSPC